MILAMNIGNTNFTLGIKNNNCTDIIKRPSNTFGSRYDFTQAISILTAGKNIGGAIISSVNPALTEYLKDAIEELFTFSPVIVNPSMNMSLDLSAYDVNLLGSDRIAVCEAVIYKYGSPAIVFDFGTATTINVINEHGQFLGGSILPGFTMGLNALADNTAQLFKINASLQPSLIGQNTEECLISGAVFGNAAMLDGMIQCIEAFLNQKTTVLVTGGSANSILPVCTAKVIHKPELLMDGLFILYDQNIDK